jgi:uncharacterized protein (TIGR02594 family)
MMTDLLTEFLSHYGLREIDGKNSNPEIVAMAEELGFDMDDDSTLAWCSLAMNYYAKKCGYEYTKSLAARSWLNPPTKIMVLKPTMGDIVVLWRGSPMDWRGHVGLFINWDNRYVWVLGGNTNNSISIAAYPRDRILGFRQLKKRQ